MDLRSDWIRGQHMPGHALRLDGLQAVRPCRAVQYFPSRHDSPVQCFHAGVRNNLCACGADDSQDWAETSGACRRGMRRRGLHPLGRHHVRALGRAPDTDRDFRRHRRHRLRLRLQPAHRCCRPLVPGQARACPRNNRFGLRALAAHNGPACELSGDRLRYSLHIRHIGRRLPRSPALSGRHAGLPAGRLEGPGGHGRHRQKGVGGRQPGLLHE